MEYVPRWTLAQLLAIDEQDEDDEDDGDNAIGPRTAANAEPLNLDTLDWGE